MIKNSEAIREKLAKFLSFADITREEIDNLFKVATSADCEYMHITWRKKPHYVKFDVGIVLEENSHRKSKVLTVGVKTDNTVITEGIEHTEGKFQTFIAESKLLKKHRLQEVKVR